MSDTRHTFAPDMETLKKELGRMPDPLPKDKPEDYAPRSRSDSKAPYISQAIKAVMHSAPNWRGLKASEMEALDLISTTISHILTNERAGQALWDEISKLASGAME